MSRPARTGVTLIEVIVVLAMVIVLTGLTLAAVQRARASAARAACGNNVRQLGLALHNYHGAYGRLPAGLEPPSKTGYSYLPWSARLLPYLEQAAVWDEIVREYAIDRDPWHIPPHLARLRSLPAFACPADLRALAPPPDHPGLLSYAGVSGTQTARADGLFFMGSAIRLADITDGMSNTLAIGERPPSADLRLGWWHAGWGQRFNHSAFDTYLGVVDLQYSDSLHFPDAQCPYGPYQFRSGTFSNQCDAFHFWSPHPGGAHFLLADGAVRFLSYVAAPLLPALATRAAGDLATLPD